MNKENLLSTKSDFDRAKKFGHLDAYKLDEGEKTNEELLEEQLHQEYWENLQSLENNEDEIEDEDEMDRMGDEYGGL